MKLGVGVLFVAIGLVLLWLAVTDRLPRLSAAWGVLKGDTTTTAAGQQPTGGAASPAAQLQRLASVLNVPAQFPALPTFGFSNN